MFFKALKENYQILEKYLDLYINNLRKNKSNLSNFRKINACIGIFKELFSMQGWNSRIINDFENFLKEALNKKTIDETTIRRIKGFMNEINKIIQGANIIP